MELSLTLHRGIMETAVGSIINKFKVRERRDLFFFEDLLAEYLLACEKAGYREEVYEIGFRWFSTIFLVLFPTPLKRLPPTLLVNNVLKKVWINIGHLDDIVLEEANGVLKLRTTNESFTRIVGPNIAAAGAFGGVLSVLYGHEVKLVRKHQTKTGAEYVYRLTQLPLKINTKDRSVYFKLNETEQIPGFTMKDALKRGMFRLRKSKLSFRDRPMVPVESTIFHVIGSKRLLFDKVPHQSYRYFRSLVEPKTTDTEKLIFWRNLLQITGWGTVNVVKEENGEIRLVIRNPPYGLQKEKDDWGYIILISLGYLWLINKKLKVRKVEKKAKQLTVIYSAK